MTGLVITEPWDVFGGEPGGGLVMSLAGLGTKVAAPMVDRAFGRAPPADDAIRAKCAWPLEAPTSGGAGGSGALGRLTAAEVLARLAEATAASSTGVRSG